MDKRWKTLLGTDELQSRVILEGQPTLVEEESVQATDDTQRRLAINLVRQAGQPTAIVILVGLGLR